MKYFPALDTNVDNLGTFEGQRWLLYFLMELFFNKHFVTKLMIRLIILKKK